MKIYLSSKGISPSKDNAALINKVIEAAKEKSTLVFPDGVFPCASQLFQNNKSLNWEGSEDTTLLIKHGEAGIHFNGNGRYITRFSNFTLENWQTDSTNNEQHGILVQSQIEMLNVSIIEFIGDGINIHGSTGSTNADFSKFDRVSVFHCKGNGIVTKGGDANNIKFTDCDIRDCGGVGVLEYSFLGNKYDNIQVHNCRGSFFASGINNESVFIGCYAEQGSHPAFFGGEVTWLAGRNADGIILTGHAKAFPENRILTDLENPLYKFLFDLNDSLK
jgi:hypothetical protein